MELIRITVTRQSVLSIIISVNVKQSKSILSKSKIKKR